MIETASRKPADAIDAQCTAPNKVVALIPRKRPRGRPKKPPLVSQRCPDTFDVVAAGVIGIAAQKGIWAAAKERVRHRADRDKALCSAALKVLGYLLQHINRKEGFDWHAAKTIAKDLEISVRTVERAFRHLGLAGYTLREPVIQSGTKVSKRWRTTLPMLVVAGNEIRAEKVGEGPDRKFGKDPTEKGHGPDSKMPGHPDKNVGQIREEEEPEEPAPNPPPGGRDGSIQVLKAFNAYNETALRCGLQQAAKLTHDRRRRIGARLREYGLDGWQRALTNLEKSSFCTGGGDRGWRADLEFVCKAKSFSRLHDGSYDNRRPAPTHSADPDAARDFAASLERARRADEEALRCPS